MDFKQKCLNCKKEMGNHNGATQACPTGTPTRIGYITYHPTQVFNPDPKHKSKLPKFVL